MAPALELLEQPIESLRTKAKPSIHNGVSLHDGLVLASAAKHQRVMNVFRAFIADVCQQFGEGHAG
jgi:dihydroxyacetone synthase